MADKKISAFTAASAMTDADLIPIVQGGVNLKAAASLLASYLFTKKFIDTDFMVNTFADLPSAATYTGKLAYVKTSTGTILLLSRKTSGFYRSDGTNWNPDDLPYRDASSIFFDATGRKFTTGDDVLEVIQQLDDVLNNQIVDIATTSNVNVSSAPASVDGVTGVSGYIFALMGQSTASQNGQWVYNGAGVAMTRRASYNSDAAIRGSRLIARRGTSNIGKWYKNTNLTAITVGSTSITYQLEIQGGTGIAVGANQIININNTGVFAGNYFASNYAVGFDVNAQGQLYNAYITPISISYTQVYDIMSLLGDIPTLGDIRGIAAAEYN